MSEKIVLLYVDDEPINLFVFEKNFEKTYKVLTASSGEIGLEIISNHTEIQLVISDMSMPGMNGIEFIQMAKKSYENVSFFILTGFDITDEISKALEERLILKYFRKPFDLNEINKAIELALQN